MRKCPICDSKQQGNAKYISADLNFKNVKCSDCGMTFLLNPPPYEAYKSEFAWEKTSAKEKNRRKNKAQTVRYIHMAIKGVVKRVTLDKLTKYIRRYIKAGKVLDVGCASGGILAGLPHNCTPLGIEISEQLAKKAHNRLADKGGVIICDNALNGLKGIDSESCSGIIMSAYLEHEINPLDVLLEASRALKSDGVCIIKVPNFNSVNRLILQKEWSGFRYPDHVNYFRPIDLLRIADKSKLKVIRFSFWDRFFFDDNQWIILGK